MIKRLFLLFILVFPVSLCLLGSPITEPRSFFGFQPGSARNLIDYDQLVGYLERLDTESDRVLMLDAGQSPLGKELKICFLSAPENLTRLNELQEINRRLAMEPMADETVMDLVESGRVFVMLTLSMHSTEVGPSQAFPLLAWEVATAADEKLNQALENVVLMVIPCHNPDGMDMVVNHYRKTLGTRYEGSTLPGVYHKYVGHDNNRDFVTLTQPDTRVISRIYSTEWYPQVLVEKHQMGSSGPRYFVPENHDPIAENVDEEMWTWLDVFGANLSRDMTADGCTGVASHWAFDNYWPGSTETSLWKNVISMLTEAASCRVATPVYVEPNELRVRGKGLSEYKKSVNLPAPWPGGWWRLSDIVKYEISSIHSVVQTASVYREDILKFRNRMCKKEIEKGENVPPYHFVLPRKQRDPGELRDLIQLLQLHGVRIYQAMASLTTGSTTISAGDYVVPLSQPYRAFIKEVMESQTYPVRHYTPDGDVIRPYDIASWSLPLHRGVSCISIEEKPTGLIENLVPLERLPAGTKSLDVTKAATTVILPPRWNESYHTVFQALKAGLPVYRFTEALTHEDHEIAAGSFLITISGKKQSTLARMMQNLPEQPFMPANIPNGKQNRLNMPEIGLVETWFHDMDAGWTRFVLDQYDIPFTVLRPGDITPEKLADLDVIIFPDESPDILMEGAYKREGNYYVPDLSPEYRKGMGKDGLLAIMDFVNEGGIILSWRSSTGLFTGELKETVKKGTKKDKPETLSFRLPVRDIGDQLRKAGVYVPGSLLNVQLKPDHPLTWGMPESCGVFSRGTPVFSTSIPRLDMDRRVLATFPERDILISGYAENEEKLAQRTAMVWVRKGKGQLVLYGFNPQFRASTTALYKLIFNGLLLP